MDIDDTQDISEMEINSDDDTISTNISICSESSISNEFEELIDHMNMIQKTQNTIIDSLCNLSSQVRQTERVYISSNGNTLDFYDTLNDLYKESLHDLDKTGQVTFGKKLLTLLDSVEIYTSTSKTNL